jgi:hypothetical protein
LPRAPAPPAAHGPPCRRRALSVETSSPVAAASGDVLRRAGRRTRYVGPAFVGGVLLALLASQGGYFATSWGWSSLLFLLAVALVVLVDEEVAVSARELAFVGLLAAVAGWTALSSVWSVSVGSSVIEAERALLFVAVAALVGAAARRGDVSRYLLVVVAVIAVVATYALCTRCWPNRFSVVTGLAGYRLSRPIGYWNGLGILAALGVVLAIGFLSERGSRWIRFAAAGACVPLVLTLYYTFSRGAWVALAAGIVVALAASHSPLQLVAWTAIGGIAPAVGVVAATHLSALSSLHAGLPRANRAGTELGLITAGLIVAAMGLALLGIVAEHRFEPSQTTRRAIGGAVLGAMVVTVVVGFAVSGRTPSGLVSRAYHSFETPTPTVRGRLDQRLFSFSSNGRIELWRTAWRDYRGHPWLGSGAGTYERAWQANPHAAFVVKDAHGLYVETLAELGPVGLALLLGALLLPLAAALRRRARPAIAGAAGAYAAYVLHAGVDWDWELGGVTATALVLGALLLVDRRDVERPRRLSGPARAATVSAAAVLSLVAGIGYVGNAAEAAAQDDLQARHFDRASSEATRARRLEPWSSRPFVLLAEADLGRGDLTGARAELRKALAKDRGDWQAWLDLALASHGAVRRRALAEAGKLYPRSPEIAAVRRRSGGSP